MARSIDRSCFSRLGAACCLPAAVLSVLLSVTPAPVHAAPSLSAQPRQPTLQRQIEDAAHAGAVTLHLYRGEPITGNFAGLVGDWRDTTVAEARYEAWRAEQSSVTPKPGEAIVVVRATGDTLRGEFEGVGESFVALRLGASAAANTVLFTEVRELRAASGDAYDGWDALRARFATAPLMVGVGLDQGPLGTVVVSRSRIFSASGVAGTSSNGGMGTGGTVLLAVIITLVICGVAIHEAADEAFDDLGNCGANAPVITSWSRSWNGGAAHGVPAHGTPRLP